MQRGLKLNPGQSLSKSVVLEQFQGMDDRMTNQLLSVQQLAVNLGLLAQKLEDDMGTSGQASGSKQKNFFGLRKKKSGQGSGHPGGTLSQKSEANSRSSTLTSLQAATNVERANSPTLIDLDIPIENDLAAMAALSNSNPSLNSRPSSMNLSLQTKEELIQIVQELQSDLTSLVRTYR